MREGRVLPRSRPSNVLHKAFLPPPNAGLGFVGLPRNLVRADAIGGQQYDLSPPSVFLTRVSILNEASEPPILIGETERDFPARTAQNSHNTPQTGILNRTQVSSSIHWTV
jgi:hypothetical protein